MMSELNCHAAAWNALYRSLIPLAVSTFQWRHLGRYFDKNDNLRDLSINDARLKAVSSSIKTTQPSSLQWNERSPTHRHHIQHKKQAAQIFYHIYSSHHEVPCHYQRSLVRIFSPSSCPTFLPRKANNPCRLQISGVLAQEWGTPSGAINWDGLNHIRVYAVDPSGNLREWQWDGNGWGGPSYIGSEAIPGTTVTAVNDGDRVSHMIPRRADSEDMADKRFFKLRVYYKHTSGFSKERLYEGGWGDGATFP